MSSRIGRAARAVWVVLALVVLVVVLAAFDGSPNSDVGEVLDWPMLALGFPLSLAYPALFTGVAILREKLGLPPIRTSYVELVVSWSALFALGYFQWFKIVPAVMSRVRAFWRARSDRTSGPPEPPTSIP